MSFQNISNILEVVAHKPGWETYRQYCQVKNHWKSVISTKFLDKTRPISIRGQVLWVATESAAIAQHLTLQRHTLLQKLNLLLLDPLTDLHFSSADWLKNRVDPSTVLDIEAENLGNTSETQLETLSPPLQLCPRCHSPVLAWEIQRWSVCSCCSYQAHLDVSQK